MTRSSQTRRTGAPFAILAALALGPLPSPAVAQEAIMTLPTTGRNPVVFPTPKTGLPNPTVVTANIGVASDPSAVFAYGPDYALVTDWFNDRVYVLQISNQTVWGTIHVTGYTGTGTIAVNPSGTYALVSGNSSLVYVIQASTILYPYFTSSSTVTSVSLPSPASYIQSYQTEAIGFGPDGRAFLYHTTGISVLDPPYSSIAFTIPVSGNVSSGALAVSPDGNTLLITNIASNTVRIFSAPFSASSTPVSLGVGAGNGLDGIAITPDGKTALVVGGAQPALWAISAPYTASSPVVKVPLDSTSFPPSSDGFEDVSISPDGGLAILTGNDGFNKEPAAFVSGPFNASSSSWGVMPGTGPNPGRGDGAARFVPPPVVPSVAAAFTPASIPAGGTSTLALTLTNPSGAPGTLGGTAATFTNVLPSGVTFVSTPAAAQCGGAVSVTGGGTGMTLSSGVLNAGPATCTVTAQVTASTPGTYTDSSPNVVATTNVTVSSFSAALSVTGAAPLPGLTAAFNPVTIQVGQISTLTFTITNPSGTGSASGIAFTNTLPSGVTLASAPTTPQCGGTVTGTTGGGSLALGGGSVGAGPSSCTVTALVTSGTPNMYGEGPSNVGGAADLDPSSLSASLTVNPVPAELSITKSASTLLPVVGAAFSYRIQVTNTGGTAASNVQITDTIAAGLVIGTPSASAGSCLVTGQSVTCSAPSLAVGATVTVTIPVTASQPGGVTNEASATFSGGSPVLGSVAVTVVAASPNTVPALGPLGLALLGLALSAAGVRFLGRA